MVEEWVTSRPYEFGRLAIVNLRNLDSIPTALGPIRAGWIWRGGAPAHWPAADRAAVAYQGLAYSFDLRSFAECNAAPSSWPLPAATLASNAAGGTSVGDPVDLAMLCAHSAARTVEVIHSIYADLPRARVGRDGLARIARNLTT